MAKVCGICEKSAVHGQQIQHKHSTGWARRAPRSKKKWRVSFKTVEVEEEGKKVKKDVCMKCYKRMRLGR